MRPSPLTSPASANHLNLVVVNSEVLFFNIRDGPYFPTLRVLHRCAPPPRALRARRARVSPPTPRAQSRT